MTVDTDRLLRDLARRVAFRTQSPVDGARPALLAYLRDEIAPTLRPLGFDCDIVAADDAAPFLLASRIEDPALPTVLLYGHGDCVPGMDAQWSAGRAPWSLSREGDRVYGRGTADNKGQHSVNIAAIETLLATRGRLGVNVTLLMEMGEETGSVGLRDICRRERHRLRADVLIASDGPRVDAATPTLFLGARGTARLRLSLVLRPGGLHSGNWGGIAPNPATLLAHAIASLIDARGAIRVPALRPDPLDAATRDCLRAVVPAREPDVAVAESGWGEPGLSAAERLYAWNTLEVTGLSSGQMQPPLSAIPARAEAIVQLRYVTDLSWQSVAGLVAAHLDTHGFGRIEVETIDGCNASRTRLDDPWVEPVRRAMATASGKAVAVLPSFGGTLPNDVFVEELGLPTLWIPHSYPGCNQHAPDEHNLVPLLEEAVAMMMAVFRAIGAGGGRST